MSDQFYPGQRIVASDGATYTLTHYAEGIWWAQRNGQRYAQPVVVRRVPEDVVVEAQVDGVGVESPIVDERQPAEERDEPPHQADEEHGGHIARERRQLFVADGSIVPTAIGLNPALTIAALAEHIADRIVDGWR